MQEQEEVRRGNPIVTIMDPRGDILVTPSLPCSLPPTSEEHLAIEQMKLVMDALADNALGIAAVQIGVLKQVFVLRMPDGSLKTFINPSVVSTSLETVLSREGCLSVPSQILPPQMRIPRPRQVTLSYVDESGDNKTDTFEGIYARAVCHEMDHLRGQLITRFAEEFLNRQVRDQKIRLNERELKKSRDRKKSKMARKSKKRNRV